MLRQGAWGKERLLPRAWMADSLVPCALNPNYGLLWWLNTGRTRYPHAPSTGFWASGAGGNVTWVDVENDVVVVLRWTDPASVDRFLGLLLAALITR
jgi:CubicO group peptidase (beta-lactamase class C family)